MSGRGHRAAGFTLLEILVALAVFGLVLAGLAGGLRYGAGALDRQDRLLDAGGAEAADRAVRQLIARMEPGDRVADPPIVGDARSLRFVSRLPVAAGAPSGAPSGAASGDRVEAALVARGGQLLLRWAPRPHAIPIGPPPPAREEVLLSGLIEQRIDYLAPDGRWVEAWNGAALPVLVRLRWRLASGIWPEIVAAPALR